MTGYSIHDVTRITWLVVFLGLLPLAGFCVAMIKKPSRGRWAAWSLVVASLLIVERSSLAEPQGTRMLLIIVALLWSMKAVVYVESRQRGNCHLTFWQWLGFCVGWFGMRANAFEDVRGQPLPQWQEFIWRGWLRLNTGGVLIAAAWIVAHGGTSVAGGIATWRRWAATVLVLPGISLAVHFGLFNILTGVWRYFGARCSALFRAPFLSRSLAEFWGRRWNLAFSEMTAIAVFRPLKAWAGRSGPATALPTIGAFVFSGLLHELAISVPVGAGFGLPLLYFLIHGIGTLLEKRLAFLASTWAGRVWTATWVLLPLPILFHRPFLEGCVWPLIGI